MTFEWNYIDCLQDIIKQKKKSICKPILEFWNKCEVVFKFYKLIYDF